MDDLQDVARSFGFEWEAHRSELGENTVFREGRTPAEDWRYLLNGFGTTEDALDDSLILDAGCGPARLTQQMAERPGSEVIGIDISDVVDRAYSACRTRTNVHIVQANIYALPFRPGTFDFVWSNGVIHHTPDAHRAFRALATRVGPLGRLFIWVYPRRFDPFRFVKSVLDVVHITRLPDFLLLGISQMLASTSWVVLQAYRAIRRLPGLRPRGEWGRRTVRQRTVADLKLTWLDALAPAFDSRHTEAEVMGWFDEAGFKDIGAIEEPKVGVRGVAPASEPATATTSASGVGAPSGG